MAFDMSGKIDVHVHFLPPSYRKACHEHGHAKPDGMPAVPEWSEEAHLQLMDKTGIKKSMISVSTPGTHLVHNDSELAAKVTRECNSYAADLKKRMPDRFGYWASLPIPDVDLCLKEIAKTAEEGCDGYALLTNGHGHYLGDPLFDPIFAELNRRKATIFIHPTTPCIKCTDPELNEKTHSSASNPTRATPLAAKFPNPMLEFLFDTARVVSNMFLSGTIKRNPDVKIILPHLAGASPPLLSRWTGFSQLVPGLFEPCPEEEVKEALDRQFWFDLSGMVFPGQIVGLLQGTGVSHERLMYGSDFPFTKAEGVELLRGKMDAGMKGMFGEEEIRDMYYRNAEKLLQMS